MHEKIKTPEYVIKLARELRQNLTPSEQLLWQELRKKNGGCRFRKQYPVNRYILDFYCHECRLAIEIDGEVHKSRQDYDEYRDKYLESIGITTLRFSNDEISNNLLQFLKVPLGDLGVL